MIASIEKTKVGYTARFDRHFTCSVTDLWSWLTENDKLSQWFPELRIKDLREGGSLIFDMPSGTAIAMEITDFTSHAVLEFTWGADLVRFELSPERQGCHLVLIERMGKVTGHTAKDLAGWQVCLEVISSLMEGKSLESRDDVWDKWYGEYVWLLQPYVTAD
ncbi:activator of Hsp90 ATPase 1 family protein [Bacillus sp. FJAT-27264]|uniref:SRPBCC family protein n=1 Tax=Paenibacillus sp. (strain DSM 101736 / FJAT-27264) TaxID=1850362 RepID=UPI000807E77C|nr:SRPBCC family protein [Bacillus sp. FJAT-27264]OBZ18250.1 activator of Hsp90 ATPase 1 family protein [Bacillus sp. FJAT-27264]